MSLKCSKIASSSIPHIFKSHATETWSPSKMFFKTYLLKVFCLNNCSSSRTTLLLELFIGCLQSPSPGSCAPSWPLELFIACLQSPFWGSCASTWPFNQSNRKATYFHQYNTMVLNIHEMAYIYIANIKY